jgi:replicative DNA helicase
MFAKEKQTIDREIAQLKIPPHSVEAEQSILGGLMLDDKAWERIGDQVAEADFYRADHRLIFSAIAQLANENQAIDAVTVFEVLQQRGEAEPAGGLPYLAELARNTPTAQNIVAYAKIVRERGLLREMIAAANDIADSAYAPAGRTAQELLNSAEKSVFEIRDARAKQNSGPQRVDFKMLSGVLEKLDKIARGEADVGIKTGFDELDKMTFGMHKSDLVIIAARPSMGKTTYAMNICEHIALSQEKPVLVFSMEMPAEQLIMRSLASLGQVQFQNLRSGMLEPHEWDGLQSTVKLLKEKNNLYIDDTAGLSPMEMRARARRIHRQHGGLSLIMVDYLQLMKGDGQSENRTNEISEISRSLKALAKELNVPVIALSQLNRGLEQRTDKRPLMADLRESGAIEQDADVIMFIYRDEVYHKDKPDNKGKAEIIIAKQRNGPTGALHLKYEGRYMRFRDHDGDMPMGGSDY